jgi:hypothetical protein
MEHVEEEIEIEYSQTPMNNNSSPWRLFHTAPFTSPLATVQSDTSSTVPSDEENEDSDDTDFIKAYIASMETFLAANTKSRQTISAKDSRRNTNRNARVNALGQIEEDNAIVTPALVVPQVEFDNQTRFYVESEISGETGGDSLLAGISIGTEAEASIETIDVSNHDKKKRLLGLGKSPARKVQVLVPQAAPGPASHAAATESMSGTATTHRDDSTKAVVVSTIVGGRAAKKSSDSPKKKLKTLDEPKKKKKIRPSRTTVNRSLLRKIVLLVLVVIILAVTLTYAGSEESVSQAAANGAE